jgi:hypothetical protein
MRRDEDLMFEYREKKKEKRQERLKQLHGSMGSESEIVLEHRS